MPPNKRAYLYKLAFEEKTGGVINYGRVYKALKELLQKYPDDSILLPAFQKYLAENDTKFLSVERFAATAGAYFTVKLPAHRDPHSD